MNLLAKTFICKGIFEMLQVSVPKDHLWKITQLKAILVPRVFPTENILDIENGIFIEFTQREIPSNVTEIQQVLNELVPKMSPRHLIEVVKATNKINQLLMKTLSPA